METNYSMTKRERWSLIGGGEARTVVCLFTLLSFNALVFWF